MLMKGDSTFAVSRKNDQKARFSFISVVTSYSNSRFCLMITACYLLNRSGIASTLRLQCFTFFDIHIIYNNLKAFEIKHAD